ncbi:hypothetical protein EE612_011930 [Oryza sativa]|nr:hypothetical protein EE612_011930 [Oryza sativa]
MGRRARCLCLLLLLLVVGGGFHVANAQASPVPPQTGTRAVNRAVSTVITVVIGVFFVLVFVCVIVNQCCDCDSSAGAGAGQGQSSAARRRRGLDPAAVAAIPVVPYAEVRKHRSGGGGALECAVCLTVFDDGDDLRLLPQCSHAFHPDCIDPWLEGHVTCPLCRANLEKQPAPSPPAVEFSSSPAAAAAAAEESRTPEAAAVRVEEVAEASDEEETRRREEEAVELESLRAVRRAARMPRSNSTGHSLCALPAPREPGPGDGCDHERFTVRLPPHVREEVLKSRRLRHATSLVLGIRGSSREGSSRGGGGSWHGARRWPSFLARTVSWARGGVGADTSAKETPRRDAV